MKGVLIVICVMVILASFVLLATINIKQSTSILVRIDNAQQQMKVEQGHPPDIVFKSIESTPINNSIKILTVKYHNTIDDFWSSAPTYISKWLDGIQIESYPNFKLP